MNDRLRHLELINTDYTEILQHATEIIFKVDAEGKFYFMSAEFNRALGYSADQLMGRHFTSIVHTDDLPQTVENFETLKQFGKAEASLTIRVAHADGGFRWVNCSAICLFDERHTPTHCIGFAHDVTELVKSQQLLAAESERFVEAMRTSARAVVEAQEKERADIGFELNNNVNQVLSTAKLYLEMALNNEKDRVDLLKRSADTIGNAMAEIHKISRSLVPPTISDLGLIASIDDLLESAQRDRKLAVEFYHQGEIEILITPEGKLMLFRIVQEQVANVLKHSEATRMVIELVLDGHSINLSISDNGKGFDKEAIKAQKSVGLFNIANRTQLFNGRINMVTSPGRGCHLNVLIPV